MEMTTSNEPQLKREPVKSVEIEPRLDNLTQGSEVNNASPLPIGMESPQVGQGPDLTALPAYQRLMITWAAEHLDPSIKTRHASAQEAFIAARRDLWYGHTRQAVALMLGGKGVDAGLAEVAMGDLDALSPEQRLRLDVWMVSPDQEATKLDLIAGAAQGMIFKTWRSSQEAMSGSSILPNTFDKALANSAPPNFTQIDNLNQVEQVIDYWEVAVRAGLEVSIAFAQAALAERDAEDANPDTGTFDSIMVYLFGIPDIVKPNREAMVSMLAELEAGQNAPNTRLLRRVTGVRERVAEGKLALADLEALAHGEEATEQQLQESLVLSRSHIDGCAAALSALGPDVEGYVGGLDGLRRGALAMQLKAEALDRLGTSSWWSRSLEVVVGAAVDFGQRLGEAITMENLTEALMIGLEIAGSVASGGTLLLIKVASWLVGLAADQDLFEVLSSGGLLMSVFDAFQGEASRWFGEVFSIEGVSALLAGVLVGDAVAGMPMLGAIEAGLKKSEGKKGLQALLGAVGAVMGMASKAYNMLVDFITSKIPKLPDAVLDVLAKVMVMLEDGIEMLGGISAQIVEAFDQLKGLVSNTVGRVGGIFEALSERVTAWVQVLGNPGALVANLFDRGLDFLLKFFIRKFPLATVRAAFKFLGKQSDDQSIVATFKGVTVAQVPLGQMIADKVNGALMALPIFKTLNQQAGQVESVVTTIAGGAGKKLKGIEAAALQSLDQASQAAQAVVKPGGDAAPEGGQVQGPDFQSKGPLVAEMADRLVWRGRRAPHVRHSKNKKREEGTDSKWMTMKLSADELKRFQHWVRKEGLWKGDDIPTQTVIFDDDYLAKDGAAAAYDPFRKAFILKSAAEETLKRDLLHELLHRNQLSRTWGDDTHIAKQKAAALLDEIEVYELFLRSGIDTSKEHRFWLARYYAGTSKLLQGKGRLDQLDGGDGAAFEALAGRLDAAAEQVQKDKVPDEEGARKAWAQQYTFFQTLKPVLFEIAREQAGVQRREDAGSDEETQALPKQTRVRRSRHEADAMASGAALVRSGVTPAAMAATVARSLVADTTQQAFLQNVLDEGIKANILAKDPRFRRDALSAAVKDSVSAVAPRLWEFFFDSASTQPGGKAFEGVKEALGGALISDGEAQRLLDSQLQSAFKKGFGLGEVAEAIAASDPVLDALLKPLDAKIKGAVADIAKAQGREADQTTMTELAVLAAQDEVSALVNQHAEAIERALIADKGLKALYERLFRGGFAAQVEGMLDDVIEREPLRGTLVDVCTVSSHGDKHLKALQDEDKARSTSKNGPAQYWLGAVSASYEQLVRTCLKEGTVARGDGTLHCYYEHSKPIGFDRGVKTSRHRAEITSGSPPILHGHPRDKD